METLNNCCALILVIKQIFAIHISQGHSLSISTTTIVNIHITMVIGLSAISATDSDDLLNFIGSSNDTTTAVPVDFLQTWSIRDRIKVFRDPLNAPSEQGSNPNTTFTLGYMNFNLSFAILAELDRTESWEGNVVGMTFGLEKYAEVNPWARSLTFNIVFMDDQCNPNVGIPNIINMQEAGVDVIFGMPCSGVTIPSGYYLKHYNIPLVTYASNNPVVSNKETYSTVVRIGAGYKQIGLAFVELFKTFHWSTVSVLTRDSSLCRYGSEYIPSAFKDHGLTVAEYNMVGDDVSDQELKQFLSNFRERARIMIVCMPTKNMLRLMELAEEAGMTSPEYTYWTFALMPSQVTLEPWGGTEGLSEVEIQHRREVFVRLKTLTPADMTGEGQQPLMEEMTSKMAEYPWYINNSQQLGIDRSPYALYMYDSVWFYLDAIRESLQEGLDPRDGRLIFEKAKNKIFQGVSGEMILDEVADRIPNYWVWQISDGDRQFSHFATIRMISEEGQRVQFDSLPYWGTEDGEPPLNMPVCGYRDELCEPQRVDRTIAMVIGFLCAALVLILLFGLLAYYRKRKFEEEIQKMSWKIPYEEIEFSSRKTGGSFIGASLRSLNSDPTRSMNKSRNSFSVHEVEQIFTKVGVYKGVLCAVKKSHKVNYKPSREDLIRLKQMKDISHENLNGFIGACLSQPEIYILTHYCSKGSLVDILEHDEIKLDWTFKCSLIHDLTNGMSYLHDNSIHSHGNLKSSTCLIDSRWALKITNFGLGMLKSDPGHRDKGEYETYMGELWTAPELLRLDPHNRPEQGTQKGDVYSFGIILQELLFRTLPYFMEDLSPKEILQQVKVPSDPPYRPVLPDTAKDIDHRMLQLMSDCWSEVPLLRPEFKAIKKTLIYINNGRKVNIMDNMVAKLEKYANNLEEIVEKRTEELVEEKKKTDILLYRMMPTVVADKLKHGLSVPPEIFESVTIYFSDVVGFTSISSDSTPMQVVDLLNDLYILFDDIIARHDVYKVETIGDAYMCASGLPNRNGGRHAAEIANMSLELRENVKNFRIRHLPTRPLQIRIGLHTGSCAAGVVGLTMPRYCLFGDTVNVASRMESNGAVMKIHISEVTFEALKKTSQYILHLRGQVELKGKGLMTSYWLENKV